MFYILTQSPQFQKICEISLQCPTVIYVILLEMNTSNITRTNVIPKLHWNVFFPTVWATVLEPTTVSQQTSVPPGPAASTLPDLWSSANGNEAQCPTSLPQWPEPLHDRPVPLTGEATPSPSPRLRSFTSVQQWTAELTGTYLLQSILEKNKFLRIV